MVLLAAIAANPFGGGGGGDAASAMTADAGGALDTSPADTTGTTGSDFPPVVSRISGADRYELAAEIGKRVSPGRSDVVYLASGASFADALSAGPAASIKHGPLLLVPQDSVPTAVAASLTRLDPATVMVIGGTASVSDGVVAAVGSLVPRATVTRIAGADRYAVSRAVVADAFRGGSDGVAVATGRDFPDALSAGAAAGSNQAPVLLVDGAAPVADTATKALLSTLGTHVVTIAGGPSSVSNGIQSTILPSGWVPRVSGADRYEVSLNMVESYAPDFSTVYLATGSAFPDALAGAVLAAKTSSPLFVVPSGCVPWGVLALLTTNGTKNVVLIGGPLSLGAGVAALTPCSF